MTMTRSVAAIVLMAAGVLAGSATPAGAQQPNVAGTGGPVTSPFLTIGSGTSPLGTSSNPYFNPFLAPYLMPGGAGGSTARTAGATLLFMGAARGATGVLAREAPARSRPARAAGAMSDPQSMPNRMWVPGASASPYFHRGVVRAQGSERRAYFQRYDSYYPNIAR